MATHKDQLFRAAQSIMLATTGIATTVKLSPLKLAITKPISNQAIRPDALIGFIFLPVRLVVTKELLSEIHLGGGTMEKALLASRASPFLCLRALKQVLCAYQ
jgi:hypothetical protein